MIANSPFPTQRQPIVNDGDGRDFLAREEEQDRMEEPAVHDGEFYIDSADCVIRVDNTLFRVSAMLLSANSPSCGLRSSSLLAFLLLLVVSARGIVPLCSRCRWSNFHFLTLTVISMPISMFAGMPADLNADILSARSVCVVGPSVLLGSGLVCIPAYVRHACAK